MERGSITITCSLVIVVLISLFLSIFSGIQFHAVTSRTNLIATMGMDSVFAEYNRELLDQYDLFYIDSSYCSSEGGIGRVAGRLTSLMERNATLPREFWYLSHLDFMKLYIDQVVPVRYHIASDYQGYSIREQAISYEKDKVGIGIVETVLGEYEILKYHELDTRNLKEEQRQLVEQASVDLPDEYKIQIVNMVSFLSKELGEVSQAEISLANTTFYRSLGVGVYAQDEIPTNNGSIQGLAEEVLFQEYLFDHCSYYGKELDKSHLKYQMEYLIAGGNKDSENLNSVLLGLLTIREVSNFIFLISDTERVNMVDLVAKVIALFLDAPNADIPIRTLLLGVWATYESILDVKSLIAGERVPLMKSDDSWKSSFGDGLGYTESGGSNTGLTYKDYLQLLLLVTDRDKKVYRFMDVIESDLAKTAGNSSFRIDHCMDAIVMQMYFKSGVGYECEYTKKYRYGI